MSKRKSPQDLSKETTCQKMEIHKLHEKIHEKKTFVLKLSSVKEYKNYVKEKGDVFKLEVAVTLHTRKRVSSGGSER